MHILYIHQHFNTPRGSSGTRSYEFARRLVNKGHKVTICCGSYANAHTGLQTDPTRTITRGEVDGIQVIQANLFCSNNDGFLKRTSSFLRFAVFAVRIALTEKYDSVLATSTPLTVAIPGIAAKLIRRKRFVFEVRDLWPELPRAMGIIRNPLVLAAMSALEWLAYRTADACIGLSPGICEGIGRRTTASKPITMIPNGCDLSLFRPGDRSALRLPGVNPGDLVAVFTGAHGIANGLDAVLDAASELKRRGREDIKLLFIGDGKLKPALVRRAKVAELTNCLFRDPVPKTELASLLGSVDIGMMILDNIPAFYRGTSPNKFFDYIASGLPVLNNYPGWLAGLIESNRCGLVVRPDSASAFADALCFFADNRDEKRRMGLNSRKLSETDFSRDSLGNRFAAAVTQETATKVQLLA